MIKKRNSGLERGMVLLLSEIYAIIRTLNDYEEEEQGDQPPRNLVMWRARKLMKSLMMHGSRVPQCTPPRALYVERAYNWAGRLSMELLCPWSYCARLLGGVD